MTEITGYCLNEGDAERTFARVDRGTALIGTYRCIGCGKVYSEIYLNPATRDGEGGDLVELIKMKLGEIK